MPKYDYVLFDADNTLFDFDAAERRALDQTLSHHGFLCDEATRSRYLTINRALWNAFERGEVEKRWLVVERFAALQRALGGTRDPEELNAYYLARLAECAELLPGAEALCRALAPHCVLAIVTNGVASTQRGRFFHSPLQHIIPHLFISDELGCQKPQKRFFDLVLAALSVSDSRRVIVVGDTLSADIQGAKNAELDCIWYNPKRLPRNGGPHPTYECYHISEISTVILDEQEVSCYSDFN